MSERHDDCALKFCSAAELESFPPEVQTAIESAYRRGYMQGYANGREDTHLRGHSKAGRFLFGRIFDWRRAKHRGKTVMPPMMR